MGIFYWGTLSAQVGINTDNPQALFHIDPKGDTNSTTNTSDDIVLTTAGNMGIGTTTPDATLDIRGNLDFDKTNKLNGSYVESSATGVAKWKSFKLNRVSTWQITSNSKTFNTNSLVILSGTGQLLKNDIDGLSISDTEVIEPGVTGSVITIPAGRYILYPSCDINTREYGRFGIYEVGNTTPVTSVEYSMSATGISLIIDISTAKKYYLTYTAINAQSILYTAPPYTASFIAGLIIQNIL